VQTSPARNHLVVLAMKTVRLLVRTLIGALIFIVATPFSASPSFSAVESDDDCLPKYPPPPVVKLMVRVPACSDPGAAIKYVICIENCSTAEAHHVVVKNPLPDNAKFVKAEPAPSKLVPELQWNLGTIGGGAKREIILVLLPTNKDDVKNCARVQFEHGQCVTTRQAMSPRPGDPRFPGDPGTRPPVITTIPDEGAPVLDLSIRGPKDRHANLDTRYEITVSNKGKGKALNALVRAKVSPKLGIRKVSDPGVAIENVVAWTLGTLDPGTTKTMVLTVRAMDKGEHCIQVEALADPNLKKEAEICTNFSGASALTVALTNREDPVFVGGKISYPIVIKNQGTEPVTNVKLRAFVPNGLKYERANAHAELRAPLKEGQWIEFPALPNIPVGQEAKYEIFAEAMLPGVVIFHIEVSADALEAGRWITEEESITIVEDREKLKVKELSRKK
jgi:uncharacterized repeat protein (TIGR01451 family)